ncbi:MAG: hypothetical protein BGO67_04350 [Alphaproteobacteria bacterium 41-28]|nr:MAG: hypothetical protein BGO67_04350 [Alphaproteobacteria bacterium 41-28]
MKFNFILLTLLSFIFSLIKPTWAMECGGEWEQEDENKRLAIPLGTISKEECILNQVNELESQGKLKTALVLILGAVHNDFTHTYNPFLGFRALLLYEQHPELSVSKEEKKEIGRKTADTFLNILKEKKVLGRFSDFHEDFFYMRVGKYLTQVYLILFGMEVDLEKLNLVRQKLSIGLEITEQIGHTQKTYLDCLIKFFTLLYKHLFSLVPLWSPDQGDAIDCYSKYMFYNELNTRYKRIAHKDFPGAMEEALECQRTISLHYLNKYLEGNFQKRFKPGVKWSMRYLAKEKTDKDKREGILTILRDCYEKRYEINVKNENELIFLTTLRPGISKGDGQYRFASFLEDVREEANRVNSLYQKAALGGSVGAQFKLYLLLKENNDIFNKIQMVT